MASKTLLSAVELEVFTRLGAEAMTADQLADALHLDARAVPDFPDALVALGFLERDGDGDGAQARYANTDATAMFLDKARPVFEELYSDPGGLEQSMHAMTGISMGNFHALADTFDFAGYETLCDVGGATGQLCTILAARDPHLRCTTYDLAVVEPIARRTIAAAGLTDRVATTAGDFFADPLPRADVITMGLILHDWNLERKMHLIRSAFDALPDGGALIAVENLIDDARRENVFGLLVSLNMLISSATPSTSPAPTSPAGARRWASGRSRSCR